MQTAVGLIGMCTFGYVAHDGRPGADLPARAGGTADHRHRRGGARHPRRRAAALHHPCARLQRTRGRRRPDRRAGAAWSIPPTSSRYCCFSKPTTTSPSKRRSAAKNPTRSTSCWCRPPNPGPNPRRATTGCTSRPATSSRSTTRRICPSRCSCAESWPRSPRCRMTSHACRPNWPITTAHQNLLTGWFTAEYGLWFGYLLPGMMRTGTPIPLGGTSNHLRRSVLDDIGSWDPYNVTEDADLGLRIAASGYRTAVLDSRDPRGGQQRPDQLDPAAVALVQGLSADLAGAHSQARRAVTHTRPAQLHPVQPGARGHADHRGAQPAVLVDHHAVVSRPACGDRRRLPVRTSISRRCSRLVLGNFATLYMNLIAHSRRRPLRPSRARRSPSRCSG